MKNSTRVQEIENALEVLLGHHTLGQYSLAVDTIVLNLPFVLKDYKLALSKGLAKE